MTSIKILELVRLETSVEDGTFGILKVNKQIFCSTLELPWKMNEQKISCIPEGQYRVFRYQSPKFGATWQVMGVYSRSYVLFHAGNIMEDVEGCILLGQYVDKLRDDRAVKNSGDTFKRFMAETNYTHEMHLTIRSFF
jgi:hypothetical protein